ncbi:MAG: LysR family transcriptional regulator [Steroidobacteraceae bacterium]
MPQPRIALEQWSALVSVVESGGYAQAAERLARTQSTITYNIQKLESVLGVQVFEIQGRKAQLTAAGQVLYRRGKGLLEQAARLERAAADLARGWEPEVRIAVDLVFPTWVLLECFAQFARERPDVRIDLEETVLAGTEEAVQQGRVDVAIGPLVPEGILGDVLMVERFVCVAAPSHPLHSLGRELTLEDLAEHRHLVVRDSSPGRNRSGGWLNERRWTVSNKATSIHASGLGLGFAWYPVDNIAEELKSGKLVPLPLREGAERRVTLYLMFADRDAAGPGARLLAQIIQRRVQETCEEKGR